MNFNLFKLDFIFVAATAIFTTVSASSSYAEVWQPQPGFKQVAIWPGTPPGETIALGKTEDVTKSEDLIAGKPYLSISNVSVPTMTIYPPKGKNNGGAMVVFPGGGFEILAIDLEGTEICDWVNANGMTCVVLKYRVPYSADHWDDNCKCHVIPKTPAALQDAQRALRLIRSDAKKWNIDPHKIGVIGFSAGGFMIAQTSTLYNRQTYPPIDDIDKISARPDFAIGLYPGHLWRTELKPHRLNSDVPVTAKTSPTLLIQSTNDPVDVVDNSLVYYRELKNAGVKVEMHLFSEGGHAFGLRPTDMPITHWPTIAEAWLKTIGILEK